jgi:hypothetical protein
MDHCHLRTSRNAGTVFGDLLLRGSTEYCVNTHIFAHGSVVVKAGSTLCFHFPGAFNLEDMIVTFEQNSFLKLQNLTEDSKLDSDDPQDGIFLSNMTMTLNYPKLIFDSNKTIDKFHEFDVIVYDGIYPSYVDGEFDSNIVVHWPNLQRPAILPEVDILYSEQRIRVKIEWYRFWMLVGGVIGSVTLMGIVATCCLCVRYGWCQGEEEDYEPIPDARTIN